MGKDRENIEVRVVNIDAEAEGAVSIIRWVIWGFVLLFVSFFILANLHVVLTWTILLSPIILLFSVFWFFFRRK